MSTQVLKTHVEMVDGKLIVVTEDVTDQAIVGGVEQTAPRVTIEQIEAEIESEHYFTAADGATKTHGPNAMGLQRTLFCVLVLKNGMRVEGVNHGSVSANNYSAEYARKDAREKAIDKLWPMFGFELAQKLYREKQAADDKICCDLCGEELTYKTANHFSGFLNGERSIHIHLCNEHASGLPLIAVEAGAVSSLGSK